MARKPKQKESAEQLQARVLNHVNYLVSYFELVEDKEQTFFETTVLQTPLRFYPNGISLPTDFETDNKWRSCFYDEADAKAAGKMLARSIRSITTYPAVNESYTEGYYKALKIMAQYLQK